MSQDTSAQHVTASMSWQEQRTHLPQLKSRSAAPGKSGSAVFPPLLRNPGWFQVPAAAQLQHQPCLQGTQNCWCQTPSEQLPVLQGCPSTARHCQSRRWL